MRTEVLIQCLSELTVIEMRVLGWYKGLLEILDMKSMILEMGEREQP